VFIYVGESAICCGVDVRLDQSLG